MLMGRDRLGGLVVRKLVVAAAVAVVLGLAAFWAVTAPVTVSAAALPLHSPDPGNGKTMFLIGGCASCHATPNQDDPTRLGGGLGLKSPFGTFYAPNISPDPNDGIGRWSEAEFVTAVMKGTSPERQHLYPAFPYTSYQHMKVDDVRDLFAFLKTLPAVQAPSKPHELPFPYNIRRTLGVWKFLYLDGKAIEPEPARDAAWNRGAYLVNGPGHCAECHSPRDWLGGIVARQKFAGGPDPSGGDGWIPNITQQDLGDWSAKQIADMLETGMTPDDKVGGAMAEVVRNTAQLTPEDRAAIAAYIKSLPPVEGPKQPESK